MPRVIYCRVEVSIFSPSGYDYIGTSLPFRGCTGTALQHKVMKYLNAEEVKEYDDDCKQTPQCLHRLIAAENKKR
jgi:hypothetical protein